MKAVDAAYPLYGEAVLDPPGALSDALAQRDGVFGAVADPALLARLDIKPPARVTIGNATIEIRAALASEPDKLAGGIGFGPRLLVSEAALRATGLLQPGSLVHWHYRLRLPTTTAATPPPRRWRSQARAKFPEAGWDIRNRSNASPQLERNVERFTQFLTIVGLTALLVGGVGVGNAVKSHLDRRRDIIATLKALGAIGPAHLHDLSHAGAAAGAGRRRHRHGCWARALPFGIVWTFGAIIPFPIIPAVHPGELALALLYGLLTALAFALWPLGRAHDVPVGALFRDAVAPQPSWPRAIYSPSRPPPCWCWLRSRSARLRPPCRDHLCRRRGGVFLTLRLVAALLMAVARQGAARQLDHACAWRSPISTGPAR